MNYAVEGIISFSTAPLRLAVWIGLLFGTADLIYIFAVLIRHFAFGIPYPQNSVIIFLILLIGSLQFLCIGLIGEYIGRTFVQSKDRPVFIARETLLRPSSEE